MKKVITLGSFIACVYILNSCVSRKYIYSPSTANLLQLEKKNDLKMAVGFAMAGRILRASLESRESNGIDAQTAYAVNKKIGVRINGYRKWESSESNFTTQNNSPFSLIRYEKLGIELSGGYYNFTGEQKQTAVQLFAGTGIGKFSFKENYNVNEHYYHNMNYLKVFIQPSLSNKFSKNYLLSLVTEFSLVKYYNISTNYVDLEEEPLGYIDKKPSVFVNFIVQNEFGFNKLTGIKFQLQTGLTTLLTNFSSENRTFVKNQYDYNNVWFAFGIITDVKKLFFRKK